MFRDLVFRLLYYVRLPGILRLSNNYHAIRVLCLHRVSDQPDYFWPPLRIETFERLIKHCVEHYEIVPLHAIDRSFRNSKPLMAITFDDGYKDFIQNALPILAKYQVPSNLNVVVNCVDAGQKIWTQTLNDVFSVLKEDRSVKSLEVSGEKYYLGNSNVKWNNVYLDVYKKLLQLDDENRMDLITEWIEKHDISINPDEMMNWDDLRECMKRDVEIGSHTMSHDNLASIDDQDTLVFEIKNSKVEIEKKLNAPIDTLALPNGQYNNNVIDEAVKAGYKRILLSGDRLFLREKQTDLISLVPRMTVYNESIFEISHRIEYFHQYTKWLQRHVGLSN